MKTNTSINKKQRFDKFQLFDLSVLQRRIFKCFASLLEEFIETPRHEMFRKMRQGSTDAHVDISGAVNLMMNVVEPELSSTLLTVKQRETALRALLDEGGVPQPEVEKFIQSGMVAGALWHMWNVKDTQRIRKLLKETDRKQYKTGSGNDPIHDQDTYITRDLRYTVYIKSDRESKIIKKMGPIFKLRFNFLQNP